MTTASKEGALVPILRFIYQFARAWVWVYENIWQPAVQRPVFRAVKWLFWHYRSFWEKVVYDKKGYFSKTRAGLMLTATLGFLYIMPSTLFFAGDVLLFAATVEREEVYLTSSQEIDMVQDIHNVEGCTTLPCSEQSAIYLRVRPNFFNHVWSMFHHGSLFYPDYVAAVIPQGLTKCSILTYGIRVKVITRHWDAYPDLLDATCARPEDRK